MNRWVSMCVNSFPSRSVGKKKNQKKNTRRNDSNNRRNEIEKRILPVSFIFYEFFPAHFGNVFLQKKKKWFSFIFCFPLNCLERFHLFFFQWIPRLNQNKQNVVSPFFVWSGRNPILSNPKNIYNTPRRVCAAELVCCIIHL